MQTTRKKSKQWSKIIFKLLFTNQIRICYLAQIKKAVAKLLSRILWGTKQATTTINITCTKRFYKKKIHSLVSSKRRDGERFLPPDWSTIFRGNIIFSNTTSQRSRTPITNRIQSNTLSISISICYENFQSTLGREIGAS